MCVEDINRAGLLTIKHGTKKNRENDYNSCVWGNVTNNEKQAYRYIDKSILLYI